MRTVGIGKKQMGVVLDEDFANALLNKLKKKNVTFSIVTRKLLEMWCAGKIVIKSEF